MASRHILAYLGISRQVPSESGGDSSYENDGDGSDSTGKDESTLIGTYREGEAAPPFKLSANVGRLASDGQFLAAASVQEAAEELGKEEEEEEVEEDEEEGSQLSEASANTLERMDGSNRLERLIAGRHVSQGAAAQPGGVARWEETGENESEREMEINLAAGGAGPSRLSAAAKPFV